VSFRNLTGEREFRVYCPDITASEVKNQPYTLKVEVPEHSEFVQVMQIESPLAGMAALSALAKMDQPKLGYAFLVWSDVEKIVPWYITSVPPNAPFPWHVRRAHGLGYKLNQGDITCWILGVSSHSGVPLLHIRTEIVYRRSPEDDEKFETELKESGYMVVPSKPHDIRGLMNILQQHGQQQGQGAVAPEAAAEAPTKTET